MLIDKGYIEFFAPDVFVEAEDGLLEEAALGALREQHVPKRQVLPLKSFPAPQDHRDWCEPVFGLNIIDMIHRLYETDQRFQPRDERRSVLTKAERRNGLVEAVFGVYPRQRDVAYIAKGYKDIILPKELTAKRRFQDRDDAVASLDSLAHELGIH